MSDTTLFQVKVEPSGHGFTAKEGETVLQAALREGILLPYSCRTGSCGTCKGTVLSGAVEHGEYDAKALSDDERAAGKALFCQAKPISPLLIKIREVVAPKDVAVKLLPARIVKLERAADDVMVMQLKLPQHERLDFLAGQYIDILLRDGQRRSFSIANPPPADTIELHIRHVVNGQFTGQVFTQLKEKDLLRFRGPLGMFFLRDEEAGPDAARRPIIFVAGGTGFAPIKAMVLDAIARGLKRPMHLYWGARTPRDLYMNALAQSWTSLLSDFRYTPVLSHLPLGEPWGGRTGWPHEAVLADYPDLSGHDVYASGPPPMIDAIRASFFARGLAEERLHYDSFEFAHH
jgi:CDP-4-dehydro-6-deoxyglucose reductase, E3